MAWMYIDLVNAPPTGANTYIEVNNIIATSEKTVNLNINENAYSIDGSTFTPPITKEPKDITAYKIEEDGSGKEQEIIQGFVKNGDYYDIVIAPLVEQILNVKITVQ